MKKNAPHQKRTHNSIRIISGRWKRRILPVIEADGLRPTGDRVRETLFNWLTPYIGQARTLDLFAGTGALGLEALSRGADFVHFTEKNPAVAKQLDKNLRLLNANSEHYELQCTDALNWLELYRGHPFDLIFLDPPFAGDHWNRCCGLLNRSELLSTEALIYVESSVETKLNVPQHWQIHRSLKAGRVQAQLFRPE